MAAMCATAAVSVAPAQSGEPGNKTMSADLPPLLAFQDGKPVRTVDDWCRRKREIRRLMIETFVGSFPEEAPPIVKAEVPAEAKKPDGSTRRRIKLTLGTRNNASFELRVWIPRGSGPFPLLMTAPRYYQIGWAEMALERGYVACLYPGLCFTHHEKDFPGYENVYKTFQKEYPDATWSSIAAKAWLAGRALDYLLDPENDYAIDSGKVGIIGWSRYGKQSMIAAAFDERITSVVARSPGSPAASPYRFTSRNTFAEAPPDFPGPWFRSDLKSYYGREHELPIDAHGWLALIAPRRCLIHTAHNDGCEPTFAVERAYLEGRKVYEFLGQAGNLRLQYRMGEHGPLTDEHRRQNLDWFDLSFGRGGAKQDDFPEEFIHRFDWPKWKVNQTDADLKIPAKVTGMPGDRSVVRDRIAWSLGREPDGIEWDGRHTFLTEAESKMMTHDRWSVPDTARMPVSFGANVRGNLYYNPTRRDPVPAVIWLHPFSYASGYNEGYGVQGTTVYHRLAKTGLVVLAYDQCGFGLRLLEGRDFYETHPRWSRLGRMIHDIRAAVDFLADGKGRAKGNAPRIDKSRIFVLGYSVGGMAGLYAAALDDRIAGVASFCGFTPLRTDTDDKPTGGIRRLWEWHALQPKLGLFQDRQADIPYDFDDVLSLIAPRPCLIVSPKRDRDADHADVVACVNRARKAWPDNGDAPRHLTPDDINRFQADQHGTFLDWINDLTSHPGRI